MNFLHVIKIHNQQEFLSMKTESLRHENLFSDGLDTNRDSDTLWTGAVWLQPSTGSEVHIPSHLQRRGGSFSGAESFSLTTT